MGKVVSVEITGESKRRVMNVVNLLALSMPMITETVVIRKVRNKQLWRVAVEVVADATMNEDIENE